MKYCPITYEAISENETYSQHGLRLLSPKLVDLKPLALSAAELRSEAASRAGKMSVQGVQTKLSARLKIKEGKFEIVDKEGQYLLKPPSEYYPELPENEAITMSMAALVGIEVPVHGLIYDKDGSMTYFIKRFDRLGHRNKLAVEDFSQLLQAGRDTKYDSSMEKIIDCVSMYCTFPKIELAKLFRYTVFNFLIGNEDMHLKNFSLITRNEHMIALAPAYDLLNTTIAQKNTKEEMALPLNGKKNNLRRTDFMDYLGKTRLQLSHAIIEEIEVEFQRAIPLWKQLIAKSFLSKPMQVKYLELLEERCQRLGYSHT